MFVSLYWTFPSQSLIVILFAYICQKLPQASHFVIFCSLLYHFTLLLAGTCGSVSFNKQPKSTLTTFTEPALSCIWQVLSPKATYSPFKVHFCQYKYPDQMIGTAIIWDKINIHNNFWHLWIQSHVMLYTVYKHTASHFSSAVWEVNLGSWAKQFTVTAKQQHLNITSHFLSHCPCHNKCEYRLHPTKHKQNRTSCSHLQRQCS